MAWNCKFNFTDSNYKKVSEEVKNALGSKYNGDLFKLVADTFVNNGNNIKSLTKKYVLQHWPQENAPQEKISRSSTEASPEISSTTIVQYPGFWTRAEAAKPENQDKLYIFTDNTDRNSGNEPISDESKYAKKYGVGKHFPKYATSAVLRGLDNAMPISTQRWYHGDFKREKGRWTNADVEEFRKVVHQEVDDIIEEWRTGNYNTIVLPKGGLLAETGITGLNDAERSEIKKALEEEVKRLYDAVGVPYTSEAAQMEKSEQQKKEEAIKAARKESYQKQIQAVRWSKFAGDNQAVEVSRGADVFGRQFSPEAAVLAEGTTITIKRGGKRKGEEQTFDIGGYSIEAAFQMIKGYTRNPKGVLLDKDGRLVVKVDGREKPAVSKILKTEIFRNTKAARNEVEEFLYTTAYKPLYRLWANQNKELVAELRKQTKGKILTDKYAGSRISPARALAEILFGTPKAPVSERVQTHYDIQRQNAIRATQQINRTVKSIKKPEGIKLLARQDNSDSHIANLVNNKNDKGQQTVDNKFILSFSLSPAAMTPGMELFVNPFEGEQDEKKAVNKFIQWILPNDPGSLPDDLRVDLERRDKIRSYLAKGGYKKYTIVTDGSPKNAIYARTLRYIIDNFEELRERYNPVDIQDFALAYHNITVTTEQSGDNNENHIMRFSPKESEISTLDDTNSMRLERVSDAYILSFPDNFDSYTKSQKERLFKTIAMAVPEGYTVTLNTAIASDSMLDFFNKVTDRGFTKVGDTQVAKDSGETATVGVFKRNGYKKEQVVTRPLYSLDDIKDSIQPDEVYLVETDENNLASIRHPSILGIPTAHSNHRDYMSYWNDSGFEEFQTIVDRVMDKARKAIAEGKTIVMPKGLMGSGSAALKYYAPRCFEYLNQQLDNLKEFGNREHLTKQFLSSSTATVEAVESSPSEDISLDTHVLQGARATLRQVFTNQEIQDFARYIARLFIDKTEQEQKRLFSEVNRKLSSTTDADEMDRLIRERTKLTDQRKGVYYALKKAGMESVLSMVKNMLGNNSDAYADKYHTAARDEYFRLLFEYAVPFIEDEIGIRINISSKEVEVNESEANQNDRMEDTEGENTPEMLWSYQHRLVNPYTSLTRNIRKIISHIKMRDPNNPSVIQKDSIGNDRYWDAQYIYHSIMSRMAKMPMDQLENFVVMIPQEQFTPERLSNIRVSSVDVLDKMWHQNPEKLKDIFPIGIPTFPFLEGMRNQYPWADDLIIALRMTYNCKASYDKMSYRESSGEEIANSAVMSSSLGNVASQFYTNFMQQYVPYCTMVDGRIIEENKPTGEASMKQAAITNYEGNVRFPGIDMVYNADGSVNTDNVVATLIRLKNVRNELVIQRDIDKSFWGEIEKLKKDYESYYDMWNSLSPVWRNSIIKPLCDALRACGIVMTEYDVFLTAIAPPRTKYGESTVTMLTLELQAALESIKGLPADEHMFQSTYLVRKNTDSSRKYETPNFYWNNLFRKFGDTVSSREYESSFRVLGKSRYSYTAPSYMSMTMLNLTNPDKEARQRYIEENFMPYDWFYDKNAVTHYADGTTRVGKFRNQMLDDLYYGDAKEVGGGIINPEGKLTGLWGTGHDIICKKDSGTEKEYSDWTPADIYEIMFRELQFPSNTESGNYVIPVLSDSRICKVIQASKNFGINELYQVILQEMERMKLVSKRNTILRMQELEDKLKSGKKLEGADKTYFDNNLSFYQKYKNQHTEKLQEVENFDKNGSNFCFFPELNDYRISLGRYANNEFMQKVITALSKNPNAVNVSFRDFLFGIQNMTDDTFRQRAEAVGLTEYYAWEEEDIPHTMTKEGTLEKVIKTVLGELMENKVMDWFYERRPTRTYAGKVNEALFDAILKNSPKLQEEANRVWVDENPNAPLTPAQRKAKDEFLQRVYNEARQFYVSHTAVMSNFIQLMVTDIAYYKDPTTFKGSVDFAKRWKEVYGAGQKLNTSSKFGKKIEGSIILEDSVRRSHSYDVFRGILQQAVSEGRIIQEEADAVLYKFRNITGTDAQAFRSLTSYRDLMDMIGRNSEELSGSIENLRNGTWTMRDFYTVFNTVKPFSFGPEDQDSGVDDIRMRTMVQHKNSEAVLLAIYDTLVGSHRGDANYSEKLKGINMAMENIDLVDENGNPMTYFNGEHKKAIDVVQYHSAVKVGAHGVIDINYSRRKLEAAKKAGGIIVGEGIEVEITESDSYYDVERKLSNLLDTEKISFEAYEKALDYFEPTAQEVFDIIHDSIYKNGDESLGYDNQVLHRLPYSYYCVQQPTDDHYTDNDKATFGSQPRHIIMADLPADFEIEINGKKYNREQLRERYNSLLIANLMDCYEREIEPLFRDSSGKKGDKRTALERLRERLLPIIEGNPKYGKQVKDALQIVTGADGQPTFALPLNNPTLTGQLEEIFTSLFKNAIHKQEIAGGNVILAADIGYSDKLKVRGKRDKDGRLVSVEGVECLLPAHSRKMFEAYLDERESENGTKYWVLDPSKMNPELAKLVGYRIPTEGLYSIMPLIVKGFLPQQSGSSIVVSQEITTLTGSDNDVDKLYLMMKTIDGQLNPVKAQKGAHALEMTKQQRDNELVDIFFGVTTHPKMTHLWAHPGNYDNLTINAKRLRILKNGELRAKFIKNLGLDKFADPSQYSAEAVRKRLIDALSLNLSPSRYNEMYRRAMELPEDWKPKDGDKTLLDVVVDFTNKYNKPLSPCYPDTFVAMHQNYMAGVAEKGIFANNTLDHAKLQWNNVRLLPSRTFTFEGARIEKLDERTVTRRKSGKAYQHYISEDCAECSAAAVDNGKDPILADVNSNQQTATFYGFLIRLGLGIDGASLLLSQPLIDYNIRTYGTVNNSGNIKGTLGKIAGWLKEKGVDLQSDDLNIRLHNFTNRELYENIVGDSLFDMLNKGGDEITKERMKSLYRVYSLILDLLEMNNELREVRNVIHYDSPTHAADTSMGGVIEQTKAVEELNARENLPEFDKYFSGEDQLIVYELEKKTEGKKKGEKKFDSLTEMARTTGPRQTLFGAFMQSEMPVTQAFYTLGIERIRKELAPQFAMGRPEMQSLVDRLWKYMRSRFILKSEDRRKIMRQMFRDWVAYNLSKTTLFGSDDNMTFDQKRQYYLYDYPAEFLRLKEQIPELNEIDGIRRMSVRHGQIIMSRGGKTTVTLRDFITDSFDELMQSPNPEVQKVAKDLFMYTYYVNGFEFSYMSFGNMLGTEFQRAFPEYVQALQNMNTDTVTDEDLDRFFEQFIVKRGNMNLIPSISYKSSTLKSEGLQRGFHNTGEKVGEYGGIDNVPEFVFEHKFNGKSTTNTLLRFSPEMTELYGTVIYVPVKTNTSLHYNAAQTLDEMMDVVYDQDKVNSNRRLGSKKRNATVVSEERYQSTKSQQESSNMRDGNVPEPSGSGVSVDRAMLDDTDDVSGDAYISRATGEEATERAETYMAAGDAAIQNRRVADAVSKDDSDIAEAQDKLMRDNNGKGLCIN